MRDIEAAPETSRGRAVYEMLLGVHAAIRRDLARVELLADQALDGLPGKDVRQELREIKRGGILWQLQVSCLHYCQFVHSHHNAEDAGFFPELRKTNPAIDPVIDRLEADHRRVSDDLNNVEDAARALERDDSKEARQAVVDGLGALQQNLLAHLNYEELNIKSTVLRVREDWQPYGAA